MDSSWQKTDKKRICKKSKADLKDNKKERVLEIQTVPPPPPPPLPCASSRIVRYSVLSMMIYGYGLPAPLQSQSHFH